jgi:DNA-binding GntR family transcriptional regulator
MSAKLVLVRRSLHDELVGLLRDLIVDGELKPGQKVPEQDLCRRFGVSRTPLREALKVLAAEGIVTLTPNRGATVATITSEQIDELFPIMGALEALAGELACQRATTSDIRRVRQMHDKMMQQFARNDRKGYLRLNRDIHRDLFAISGNAALAQMYEQMLVRTHAIRFIAKKSPARWQEAVDDHARMIAALEARDGARLADILRRHLDHKAQMVREALSLIAPEKPVAARAAGR